MAYFTVLSRLKDYLFTDRYVVLNLFWGTGNLLFYKNILNFKLLSL